MAFKKYSKKQKQELWEKYKSDTSNLEAYNNLIEAYLPLVEVIAVKVKSSLPPHIEIQDLINDGFFGLVDALNKFDESKGYTFETYASTRIRGEINDCLRDYDWVSRYARLKFKMVSQTETLLLEELQREPSVQEVADRIGCSVDEIDKIKSSYMSSFSVNIDDYISDSTHESFSLSEMLSDGSDALTDYAIEHSEITDVIKNVMFSLDEQESIMIYLHLYEGMKFKEIAEMTGISNQKVTKAYDAGLAKLRDALGVY